MPPPIVSAPSQSPTTASVETGCCCGLASWPLAIPQATIANTVARILFQRCIRLSSNFQGTEGEFENHYSAIETLLRSGNRTRSFALNTAV
jgi:hypothetical protein